MPTYDLNELTGGNDAFRREIVTGSASQLVVMTLEPGETIGLETHEHGDQILFVVEGDAEVLLDGAATRIGAGGAAYVPAGVEHDVRNVGAGALRLVSVYAPPEHAPGTVHETKADAEAAEHHA